MRKNFGEAKNDFELLHKREGAESWGAPILSQRQRYAAREERNRLVDHESSL